MNIPKEKNNQALIAIVDDDQSFREALESLLTLIGLRTAIFSSARDFLDSPQFPDVCRTRAYFDHLSLGCKQRRTPWWSGWDSN